MAQLEAVRPFKYMGRQLVAGDPVEPHPESATLERQLLQHRFARHTSTGESPAARKGTGRGRARTPRPPAPPAAT